MSHHVHSSCGVLVAPIVVFSNASSEFLKFSRLRLRIQFPVIAKRGVVAVAVVVVIMLACSGLFR